MMEIDIVIIGLQSAKTLASCIASAQKAVLDGGAHGAIKARLIYVDGGSTDDSLDIAQSFGVQAIALSQQFPSPGGQRNAGWRAGSAPFVLFLDSDTELDPLFLTKAMAIFALPEHEKLGAVLGQRHEKFPAASFYTWVAHVEWNPPHDSAFVAAFGGDVLVRRAALEATCGYDDSLIAGEDPDLGLRFGLAGWSIWYEAIPMTVHDLGHGDEATAPTLPKRLDPTLPKRLAPPVKFRGLWQHSRRAYRTGYGFAAIAMRHSFRFWLGELMRIVVRGGGAILSFVVALFLLMARAYATPHSADHGANASFYLVICACLACCMGLFLLCYPRLRSVPYFMQSRQLSLDDARLYAWHCSFIVIPQFLGVMRYFLGALCRRPLRHKRPLLASFIAFAFASIPHLVRSLVLCLVFCLLITGCAPRIEPNVSGPDALGPNETGFMDEPPQSVPPPVPDSALNPPAGSALEPPIGPPQPVPPPPSAFSTKAKKHEIFASAEAIKAMNESMSEDYLLGAGDVLRLEVWNRPTLSDPNIVVAPDGHITVMRIGEVVVHGRTLQAVTHEIEERLKCFYKKPEVRLSVVNYKNNKAFVLGRVTSPGLIEFSGRGTLLEALSRAGGLPILSEKSFLTKCAIIRGKSQLLWIDLRDLLQNGNMALNARIYNDDIIFIPESDDELVYVMGEVMVPGAIHLTSQISYLDALMFSGGPTKNADLTQTFVIRFDGGKQRIRRVDLKHMLEEGDGADNVVLRDNDVVYVSETGMASFNYRMQELLPAMEVLNLGTSVLERFGTMQYLRGRWYDTEGFVNGD